MWILKYILFILIPAISTYLAADDTCIKWLIKHELLSVNVNIELFQKICLFISVIFTTFVINLQLIKHENNEKQCQKEIAGLFSIIKQVAQSNFATISKNSNFTFNLRIFVPEFSLVKFIRSFLHKNKEKWFVIRNVEPFAKRDITEHLRFRVYPDKQGLVGEAYESGSIVYDEILPKTNETEYGLENSQVNRTVNLLWSICVPIFNEKNEVIAVIAFDSDQSYLNISSNKESIRKLTNTLSLMLRDSVPGLFKRKVSLK